MLSAAFKLNGLWTCPVCSNGSIVSEYREEMSWENTSSCLIYRRTLSEQRCNDLTPCLSVLVKRQTQFRVWPSFVVFVCVNHLAIRSLLRLGNKQLLSYATDLLWRSHSSVDLPEQRYCMPAGVLVCVAFQSMHTHALFTCKLNIFPPRKVQYGR